MSVAARCRSAAGGGCLQCVSTVSPVWVTNPRLDIQDANPSLQELCQLDTRSFFLLKLWSGFAVVQKLFSQRSFPAGQQSSYWDQRWNVKKDRNYTFAFIWKLHVHLFVFPQGGKRLKIHLEKPPPSVVPILNFECGADPSVCAHRWKAEPSQGAAAGDTGCQHTQQTLLPHCLPSSLQ